MSRAALPRRPAAGRPEIPGLAARRAAVEAVRAALAGRTPSADAETSPGVPLPDRDRGLARAIAGVVMRRRPAVFSAFERHLARPLPARAERVRAILAVGAAQILFLDVPDHAAVSLAVDLAREDRSSAPFAALVNGVLRKVAAGRAAVLAEPVDPLALLPPWLAARWRDRFGADLAAAIAAQAAVEPALDLTVRSDPEGWAERLGGIVLPTGTVRLVAHGAVSSLPGYAEGAWWVQDAAAALPARLLGDVAGRRVADLCAAPGGKTAILAAAGAAVTAVDVAPERLARLAANLKRLGLAADLVAADLLEWQPAAPFDAILLDAPCTATGTLRRHPEIALAKRPQDVAALADLQQRLLARAVSWLKPGGTLVFATCSLEREEGPAQIGRLLAAGAPVERRPIAAGEIGGLAEALTAEGDLVTLPVHLPHAEPRLSGLDGFFAARLVRTG